MNSAFTENELPQDHLIVYADTHHGVVVVTAAFILTLAGPWILDVGVLDPWS
jgi:hypothetical protein